MKVGVLGLGSIGQRHAKNLTALGHDVVAYDPDTSLGVEVMSSDDAVIEWAEAVVVASPTAWHYQQLCKCLDAGKHCFVEKPIAANFEQLLGLRERPASNSAIVFVGNNLRFHPGILLAKQWLENNEVGDIHAASFTLGQYTDRASYLRDGVILNWGAHEVDAALHLLGPAKLAGATARVADHSDDLADLMLTHDSGVMSVVHLDYLTRPECRAVMMCGAKGWIIADLPSRTNVMRRAGAHGDMVHQLEGKFDADYKAEMKAFIDRINGKTTIGATGEEGLATLELLLNAQDMAGVG